jgi:hypothetical protein
MKKYSFLIIALFIAIYFSKAQQISPFLVGNNYWNRGASLDTLMKPGGAMDTANFKIIRIGGFGANGYSTTDFVNFVKQIRAIGAEPIVQVYSAYTDLQAINLITAVNITNNLNVKYWSIGNEPDHPNGGSLSIATIGQYTRRISSALKSVDSTIKVIACDFSSYTSAGLSQLLGGSEDFSGKDANGNYYVDMISWHRYGVLDITTIESDLNNLLLKLNSVNQNRSDNPIGWMIGEFNMHWDNSLVISPDGYVWSFHAGQVFSDLYDMAMRKGGFTICPWSTYESDGNRSAGDLSLFDKGTPYKGRSSYYHSMMLGQNLKKNLAYNADNQGNIKVISMKDSSGVAVMIMNSDKEKSYSYSVRLDSSYGVSTPLQILVSAGINKEVTGVIPKFATQMLIFNSNGVYTKLYTYTSEDADSMRGPEIEYPETECNPSPNIDFMQRTNSPVDSGNFTIQLSGINDGNLCSQGLNIDAYILDTTIAKIVAINYLSCDSIGSIEVKPLKAGRTSVVLKLKDNGESGCNSGSIKYMGVDLNIYKIFNIPSKIECEDFFDASGLEPEKSVLGTFYLGTSNTGDYAEYIINVPVDGNYYMLLGAANGSSTTTAQIQVKEDVTILATISMANTGGWQKWTTKVANFNLSAGIHKIQLYFSAAAANLDFLIISDSDPTINGLPYTAIISPETNSSFPETESLEITASALDAYFGIEKVEFYVDSFSIGYDDSAPYSMNWYSLFLGEHALYTTVTNTNGIAMSSNPVIVNISSALPPIDLPGQIEAEDYSAMSGIQIETCKEGGENVGWIDANDWMEYNVKVSEPGEYSVKARVSGWTTTASLKLLNNNSDVLTTVKIPNTGGYQNWADSDGLDTFKLEAGVQTIKILAVTKSMNINYIKIEKVGVSSIGSLLVTPTSAKLDVGQSIKLQAWGISTDTVLLAPVWSVEPAASINQYGVFQAFSEGVYTVTATLGSVSSDVTITVTKEQGYFSVKFNVNDKDDSPLSGATVVLNGYQATTNTIGEADFNTIYPSDGLYYTVSKSNYSSVSGSVSVVDADIQLNITLDKLISSIDNPIKNNDFYIFPNPVSNGSFTINNAADNLMLLFDLNGNVLMKYTIKSNTETIYAGNLKSGLYVVRLINNSGKTCQAKIIMN